MYVPTTTRMSDTMNHIQHPFPFSVDSRVRFAAIHPSFSPPTATPPPSPQKTVNNPSLNISPQYLPSTSPLPSSLPSFPSLPTSHPPSQPTSLLPPTRRIIPRSPSSIIIVSTSIRVYTQFSKTLEPPTPTPTPNIRKVGREYKVPG